MADNAIITSAQNIVVAINSLVRATTNAYGTANSPTYTGASQTQVIIGAGRLNNITIITAAASGIVDIYDAQSLSVVRLDNKLASVDASTTGTFVLNKIYSSGLVIDIGAGIDANITYSPL